MTSPAGAIRRTRLPVDMVDEEEEALGTVEPGHVMGPSDDTLEALEVRRGWGRRHAGLMHCMLACCWVGLTRVAACSASSHARMSCPSLHACMQHCSVCPESVPLHNQLVLSKY
jgi:hypothetical protein